MFLVFYGIKLIENRYMLIFIRILLLVGVLFGYSSFFFIYLIIYLNFCFLSIKVLFFCVKRKYGISFIFYLLNMEFISLSIVCLFEEEYRSVFKIV